MENNTLNSTPATPIPSKNPMSKNTKIVLGIILAVVILLIIGVFIRAARNRQGIQGWFKKNTANTVVNNVANGTNTTTNATSNSTTSNTTQNTATNSSGQGSGGTTTGDKSKYPVGKSNIGIDFGGVARTAIIYVPKSYSPNSAMPLVVNLHGSESTAEGQENNSHMDTTAESNGFIVVYPNGINQEWNDGRSYTKTRTNNADDVAFIKELVSTISAGMNIDSHKVYAAGMSNGGVMAERLACDATSTFAAVADVAGAMPTDLKSVCSPNGKMPVIIMHGTTDPIVPIGGGDLKSGRGSVLATADTVKYWAGVNGVSGEMRLSSMADTANDGTGISLTQYGNDVMYYEVIRGGHTWPGGLQYLRPILIGLVSRDIDGSQVIWDFFKQHSR